MVDSDVSHDNITRFLCAQDYTSKDLWLPVKSMVRKIGSEKDVLIFDDTIQEKAWTDKNELICWHVDHSSDHSSRRNVEGINLLNTLYIPKQPGDARFSDAIALTPPHLSWYQLTIEPNTQYYSNPPRLPDDDERWDIFTQRNQLLDNAGYMQYKTICYRKLGFISRTQLPVNSIEILLQLAIKDRYLVDLKTHWQINKK